MFFYPLQTYQGKKKVGWRGTSSKYLFIILMQCQWESGKPVALQRERQTDRQTETTTCTQTYMDRPTNTRTRTPTGTTHAPNLWVALVAATTLQRVWRKNSWEASSVGKTFNERTLSDVANGSWNRVQGPTFFIHYYVWVDEHVIVLIWIWYMYVYQIKLNVIKNHPGNTLASLEVWTCDWVM